MMALHILLSELAQPELKGGAGGMGLGQGQGQGSHGHGKKGAPLAGDNGARLLHRLSSLRGPLFGGGQGLAPGQGQGLGVGKGKGTSALAGTKTITGNTHGAGGIGVTPTSASSSAAAAISSAYAQEPFRNLPTHEPSSSSSSSWHNEAVVADLDLSLSMISEGGEDEHQQPRQQQQRSLSKDSTDRQPRPPTTYPPGHVAVRSSRQRGSGLGPGAGAGQTPGHPMSPLSPPASLSRQVSGGSVGTGLSGSRHGSEMARSPGIPPHLTLICSRD